VRLKCIILFDVFKPATFHAVLIVSCGNFITGFLAFTQTRMFLIHHVGYLSKLS